MSNWLNRFRDDPGEPRWLDRFRDDPVKGEPERPAGPGPQPKPQVRPTHPSRPPQHLKPRPALPLQPKRPPHRQQRPRPEPHLSRRPRDILLFAALMSLSLVLGLAAIAIVYPGLAEFASPVQILLPDILVISITGTFIYLIAELRQQWAVWVLGLFCAVRLLMYLPTFPHIATAWLQLLTATYFVLQAAALWFLFTPDARRWLKGRRR